MSAVVCPGRHSQTLHLRLPELERFLTERVPLITVGRNRGEAGSALVDMVLLDNASMTAGTALSGGVSVTHDAEADSSFGTASFISNKALTQCLQQEDFIAASNQIKTKDFGTTQGRMEILEIATSARVLLFQLVMGHLEFAIDPAVQMHRAPAPPACSPSSQRVELLQDTKLPLLERREPPFRSVGLYQHRYHGQVPLDSLPDALVALAACWGGKFGIPPSSSETRRAKSPTGLPFTRPLASSTLSSTIGGSSLTWP